jgi:hypothetical protein
MVRDYFCFFAWRRGFFWGFMGFPPCLQYLAPVASACTSVSKRGLTPWWGAGLACWVLGGLLDGIARRRRGLGQGAADFLGGDLVGFAGLADGVGGAAAQGAGGLQPRWF